MNAKPSVVIFDYGFGNIRSAERALAYAGADVSVSADADRAILADGIVIPGVGAFRTCIEGILNTGADQVIAERLARGSAVLGVCVGAQVMFEQGQERGVSTPGLGHLQGTVARVDAPRIPHVGWNTVDVPEAMKLFDGVRNERFYFVHSYAAHKEVPGAIVATCPYGGGFAAAVQRGALTVTQFHPEKSGVAGLALLANWVRTLLCP